MILDIIIATLAVSLISLIGIFFVFRGKHATINLKSMISFAAGSLLAVSFLDVLPEVLETDLFDTHEILLVVLLGIVVFFILERILHWHHCRCHDTNEISHSHKHTLRVNNLIGDGLHNIIDGFLIAGAFMVNRETGLTVTLAVILHEIPQEISDFGILLYSGLSKTKALIYNLVIGLTAVLGAVAFYFFLNSYTWLAPLIGAFAAGNFIYLATADIIPELNREGDNNKFWQHTLWFLAGIIVLWLLVVNTGHHG